MASSKPRRSATGSGVKSAPAKGGVVAPAAAELLLEIGTEELPYQFVPPALQVLGQKAEHLLKEHRLAYGMVRTFGTPRRLVLVVESLSGRQAAAVKEAMGPSKVVAFDVSGQPTKAAIGFAGSQGVTVSDLEVRQTPKGEYVFAVKREQGTLTPAVLAEILPGLIHGLAFPKAMRWNETGMRFGRPIRWLLALYGGKVIPFTVGGIIAGNRTRGHRFLGASPLSSRQGFAVSDFKSYMNALSRSGVVPDQDERRRIIHAQLERFAASAKGQLHRDEELLEQAVYTVECPQAVLGSFNPQHLSLPKEVLMTAMKEHQGFFSLMRKDGGLLPKFISVTNMKLPNMRLIQAGNERVLAARLADAKFFFEEDRKAKLADRVEKLKQVVFHQKLGTMYQKQERLQDLAAMLASMLGLDYDRINACRKAAELSKADLLTGMVGEFPTLQGIMGSEYARRDGESEPVSAAIGEQYLPKAMEGHLPGTLAGKILSLADRLDTIVGFFHVGLVPTGSEDPFALRRHASAVVRILIEGNLRLSLAGAIGHTVGLVQTQGFAAVASQGSGDKQRAGSADPLEFIFERLRFYGRTVHGLRDDVMEAVLKSSAGRASDLVDLLARMKAMQAITGRPEFDPLMVGFKRAHRLVEKEGWNREEIDPRLFEHATERDLHRVLQEARASVPAAIEQGEYEKALDVLVAMKPAIDGFFVGVLVNADDAELRANRLSLLCAVDRLFMSFADFSQIVVQGA
jgi:glycyl-tRNA synthetase beta chain